MKHGVYCHGDCHYRPNCWFHMHLYITAPIRLKLQEVIHK